MIDEVKRLKHELTDAIDNMNWLDGLAEKAEAEVKQLREQQKKILEIAETNMALEWSDTDCGAEWGYIIDMIKGWKNE